MNRSWPFNYSKKTSKDYCLQNHDTVVIVGGGIAGTAFARQLFIQARERRIKPKVIMINSRTCNYCGGLVTAKTIRTLKNLFQWDIEQLVKLTAIDEIIYINNTGDMEVELDEALHAALRTSRFGKVGLDDALRSNILKGLEEFQECFHLIEPAKAVKIATAKETGNEGKVVYKIYCKNGDTLVESVQARLIVIATGLRSLESKMFSDFKAVNNFLPPKSFNAGVTEITTESSKYNKLGNRLVILDNILPHSIIALIPKGGNWITLTSLERKINKTDLIKVFENKQLQKYIKFGSAQNILKCNGICAANVFVGPAENYYGNGWVMLGDLTGRGRVLKDGYYSALNSGYYAAVTVMQRGIGRKHFARYYCPQLKKDNNHNKIGLLLFYLNSRLADQKWFTSLIVNAARFEKQQKNYGEKIHAAIRGLSNGMLSYLSITMLFIGGVLSYIAYLPFILIKQFKRTALK